jgi:hypothetical protein
MPDDEQETGTKVGVTAEAVGTWSMPEDDEAEADDDEVT